MSPEQQFSIRQAARILDIHPDTMRYWEENKLIPQPRRNIKNNYRVYSLDEIKEIAKIRGIYEVEIDSVVRKMLRNKAYA